MFGKPKFVKDAPSAPAVSVETLPAEFYGGVNPVIKFKDVAKEVSASTTGNLSSLEKKLWQKEMAAGSGEPFHPANLLSNRKFLLISAGVFLIIFSAAAGAWYYWQWRKQNNAAPTPPVLEAVAPETNNQPEAVAPAAIVEVIDVNPTTTAVVPPADIALAPLDFPATILANAADLDSDGLTDAEEEIYGIDPSLADSDQDGYSDSHEIFYLYNPAGVEPKRLISGGQFNDYINPILGNKVYYPRGFAVGSIDRGYQRVLFTALNGESIEIRAFRLPEGVGLAEWFSAWANRQNFTDLKEFATYFDNLKGWVRGDQLVYYFSVGKEIYVFLYHPNPGSNQVSYRNLLQTMARSFRPGTATIEISTPDNVGFDRPVIFDDVGAVSAFVATSSVLVASTTVL